jgi:type II secretory pathway pseudopilin PulG
MLKNTYKFQYNSYPSSYQNTSFGGASFDTQSYKPLNGLELIVVILSVIFLVFSLIFGYLNADTVNRDLQRKTQIDQILDTLDNFYLNSNTIPSNRAYPVAICDSLPNTVDFELTLREYLTGKRPEKDTHIYIQPANWPNDRWGEYSKTIGERKISLKCVDKLQLPTVESTQNIYKDGSESCNYSLAQNNKKYYQCFLYGSSTNGDKYSLGYYNEATNKMQVYTKFRDSKLTLATCSPSAC